MTFEQGDRVKVREDLSPRSGSIPAGTTGKVTSGLIGYADHRKMRVKWSWHGGVSTFVYASDFERLVPA